MQRHAVTENRRLPRLEQDTDGSSRKRVFRRGDLLERATGFEPATKSLGTAKNGPANSHVLSR